MGNEFTIDSLLAAINMKAMGMHQTMSSLGTMPGQGNVDVVTGLRQAAIKAGSTKKSLGLKTFDSLQGGK